MTILRNAQEISPSLKLKDVVYVRERDEVFQIKAFSSSNRPPIEMILEMLLPLFVIEHCVDQESLELEGKGMCLG